MGVSVEKCIIKVNCVGWTVPVLSRVFKGLSLHPDRMEQVWAWHDGMARLAAQLVAGHMISDPTGCMYAPHAPSLSVGSIETLLPETVGSNPH